MIDGRQAVKGHGPQDMPIWGPGLRRRNHRAGEYYGDMPYTMERCTCARILALIDYLNRIQTR